MTTQLKQPPLHTRQVIFKQLLAEMGYSPDRVDAAVAALEGNQRDMAPEEPLLCQKEVCTALKISHTTLWRLNLPCHVVGTRKRYRLSEVMAHLERRKAVDAASVKEASQAE